MKCVIPSCSGQIENTARGAVCNRCGATNIFAQRLAPKGTPSKAQSETPKVVKPRIILTYDSWKERTYVRSNLSGRSKHLNAVDAGLKRYLGNRTPTNFQELQKAFSVWKGSKANWQQSSRNKKGAINDLDGFIQQEQSTMGQVADSSGGQHDESQADHQRLGVLYLLGNTQVENNSQAIASQLFSSALSVANTSGITQHAHGHIKGLGGGGPTGIHDSLNQRASTGGGVFSSKRQEAQQFSRGGQSLFDPHRVPSASNPMHKAIDSIRDKAATEMVNTAGSQANTQGAVLAGRADPKLNALMAKIKQFFLDTWNKLKSLLSSAAQPIAKVAIEQGINLALKEIFKLSVPLGAAAYQALEGAYSAGKAMWAKWTASGLLRKAHIKPGHAAIMIESIASEMSKDIWRGLGTMAIGVFDGAVQLMTLGAGIILSLVKAVVVAIVKVAQIIMEVVGTKTILDDARTYWMENAAFRKSERSPEKAARLIHRNPERFNKWFAKVCDQSTPMAVLCLNSGICTNLFAMLDIPETGRSDSKQQAGFDNTQKAVVYMKAHGVKYLKNSNLKLISTDPLVSQTITRVMTGGILV